MGYMIGLDPSVAKTGFVVMDLDKPSTEVVDKGRLRTDPTDGIFVQRLIKQANQIRDKILEYDIKYVASEAPYFEGFNTEMLYALNQFLHREYLNLGVFVVYFPPSTLKKLVFPDKSSRKIYKSHMTQAAKESLGLVGRRLSEDTSDAYWAGVFGRKYYDWHFRKSLLDKDLNEYEYYTFAGKHTYTRGKKKGVTDYHGIIYRENDMFYDFDKIKRSSQDASGKENDKNDKEKDD
jgi:Holliday junction resolvasome RuvABC endonuclease subunit